MHAIRLAKTHARKDEKADDAERAEKAEKEESVIGERVGKEQNERERERTRERRATARQRAGDELGELALLFSRLGCCVTRFCRCRTRCQWKGVTRFFRFVTPDDVSTKAAPQAGRYSMSGTRVWA